MDLWLLGVALNMVATAARYKISYEMCCKGFLGKVQLKTSLVSMRFWFTVLSLIVNLRTFCARLTSQSLERC